MTYTKPPWPEYAEPTAREWAPWFLEQTPEDQVKLAQAVLDAHSAQHACFIKHAGVEEAVHTITEMLAFSTVAERKYRLAWLSARRRGVYRLKNLMEKRDT
jgi:hypothetical protein